MGRWSTVVVLLAVVIALSACASAEGSVAWLQPCSLLTEQQRRELRLEPGVLEDVSGPRKAPQYSCSYVSSPGGELFGATVSLETDRGLTPHYTNDRPYRALEIGGLLAQELASGEKICRVEVQPLPNELISVTVLGPDPCPRAIQLAGLTVDTLRTL